MVENAFTFIVVYDVDVLEDAANDDECVPLNVFCASMPAFLRYQCVRVYSRAIFMPL